MSPPRHFTIIDDWVLLNQKINSTEFRVYALMRANVVNEYGGIPASGFRVTAGWVAEISDSLFSRTTAHRALRGLAEHGVLRRLNDPKAGGEGGEFEFVVYPGEDYEGALSVVTEAARLAKKPSRSVAFSVVAITGNPANGLTAKDHLKPSPESVLGQPEAPAKKGGPVMSATDVAAIQQSLADVGIVTSGSVQEEAVRQSTSEVPPGVDPETPEPPECAPRAASVPVVTAEIRMGLSGKEAVFAVELEQATARLPEERLRLMPGACDRVAMAVRHALELGWEPKALAKRLASELNPQVRMPENLLIGKARDLGAPPPVIDRRDGMVMIDGRAVDLGEYDLGFGHLDEPSTPESGRFVEPEPMEAPVDEGQRKRERLARLARKNYRIL